MMVLFITVMGSGAFIKKPFSKNDDVMKQIRMIEQSVKKSEWDDASSRLDKSFRAWGKVKNRIQFSVERDFLEEMDSELGVLKGAIKAEDEKYAILTVEKIRVLWEELGQ